MIPADLDITALPVGHLPVVRAAIDALGFKAVVDKFLPKHPLANASDAECVIAMVLNILSLPIPQSPPAPPAISPPPLTHS
jgi:hypothetical protein